MHEELIVRNTTWQIWYREQIWVQRISGWSYHIDAEKNYQHFADDISVHIFVDENVWISIIMSLKFDPMAHIDKNQHWFR